jgi:hypothetical protein
MWQENGFFIMYFNQNCVDGGPPNAHSFLSFNTHNTPGSASSAFADIQSENYIHPKPKFLVTAKAFGCHIRPTYLRFL